MSNIIGLGLDATEIPRIAALIERYGERFIRRLFTDGEVAYCNRRRTPAIHFAGRFAAKEAGMKALGTGHSQEFSGAISRSSAEAARRNCSFTGAPPGDLPRWARNPRCSPSLTPTPSLSRRYC